MQILETDPVHAAPIRQALIRARLLVPAEARSTRTREACDHPLDAEGVAAVALEIVATFGVERAREIALDSTTDQRVVSALFVLLGSDPGEQRARIERFRARARREAIPERTQRERDPGYESRGMRELRR